MADQRLNPLTQTTYTKDNFHRKVLLLKGFFSHFLYEEHTGGDLKGALDQYLTENNVGEHLKRALLDLPDDFYSFFTKENVNAALDELSREVMQAPHLVLYVATVLPPSEVEKLGIWVREHIRQGLFIDLKVDASVIGGCAFVWNGTYHDYSLRYFFDQHRSEIRALIRSTEQ